MPWLFISCSLSQIRVRHEVTTRVKLQPVPCAYKFPSRCLLSLSLWIYFLRFSRSKEVKRTRRSRIEWRGTKPKHLQEFQTKNTKCSAADCTSIFSPFTVTISSPSNDLGGFCLESSAVTSSHIWIALRFVGGLVQPIRQPKSHQNWRLNKLRIR